MKRRLFNLAALLSLILCLGTGLLWGRSLTRGGIAIAFYGNANTWSIDLLFGGVRLEVAANAPDSTYRGFIFPSWIYEHGMTDVSDLFGTARLAAGRIFDRNGNWRNSYVILPFWILFIVFALLPTRWAILKRRETKRKKLGCCKVCGYDLRATPERCPECGTEVKVEQ